MRIVALPRTEVAELAEEGVLRTGFMVICQLTESIRLALSVPDGWASSGRSAIE